MNSVVEHPAIANLRSHQAQLDADGVMVGVSRQALDETLALYDALLAAGRTVLAGLNARIEAAPLTAVPVFDGIVDLHDAIGRANQPGETSRG